LLVNDAGGLLGIEEHAGSESEGTSPNSSSSIEHDVSSALGIWFSGLQRPLFNILTVRILVRQRDTVGVPSLGTTLEVLDV